MLEYELQQIHGDHRLTLSECFPPGPPRLALCLTGQKESPEVYLSPAKAHELGITLLRFAFERKTLE